MGILESRYDMCVRPQKAVTRCGMQIIRVMESGHGQLSDMVGAGACDMTTRDGSCCSLIALAMKMRAGEPLTVMAECVSEWWEA